MSKLDVFDVFILELLANLVHSTMTMLLDTIIIYVHGIANIGREVSPDLCLTAAPWYLFQVLVIFFHFIILLVSISMLRSSSLVWVSGSLVSWMKPHLSVTWYSSNWGSSHGGAISSLPSLSPSFLPLSYLLTIATLSVLALSSNSASLSPGNKKCDKN